MTSYNFYDLNDLKKVLDIVSYDFKNKTFLNKYDKISLQVDSIDFQKELTSMIKKANEGVALALKDDIKFQIEKKYQSIKNLQDELKKLEAVSGDLDKAITFERVFEIISKS